MKISKRFLSRERYVNIEENKPEEVLTQEPTSPDYYEISSPDFDMDAAIKQGDALPKGAIDAVVWNANGNLKILLDPDFLSTVGDDIQTTLFLWEYFEQAPFNLRQTSLKGNQIFFRADKTLMQQMRLRGYESARLALGIKCKNRYYVKYNKKSSC